MSTETNKDIIVLVQECPDDKADGDEVSLVNLSLLKTDKNNSCKAYAKAIERAMKNKDKMAELSNASFIGLDGVAGRYAVNPPCYVTAQVSLYEGDNMEDEEDDEGE